MVEITGVVKFALLLSKGLPPVDDEYQSMVLPEGTKATLILTVPAPQREPFTAVARPGIALTVTVTLAQPALKFPLLFRA